MKKIYEESEIETTAEEKAHGLRRIKRRHFTALGEMTLKNCVVTLEIKIDADVLKHLRETAGENDYKAKINSILREKMEETERHKTAALEQLRRELLADSSFLQELKEKLAA